ncbi:hypothetical protein EJ05DRAFT_478881 [Pseudovirgaria hyperparasitica]|uniref:Glycoside hydrolase family 32 protein n=1 Tax=Pseudovirgaria hyperparasitica TaxID=470096 RepID=A0A6A6VWV3_9PEZI|nr:uncharacterized protein EJ05DRAFT_478881 [Pseudovirgaria hyperparasitica]KAF2755072.1 hypothetical protein EJ05DRAFT_478881 [Pseudovirgaria hyperparasitica]
MNDPNGMFKDANGTWHLYYQYNPTATVAGNQHWGHATSSDLYHWTNQPIALFPPTSESFVFSGSIVVDSNNTSGFFPSQSNGVVAIYTVAQYPSGAPGPQTQNIAYSTDGGYSFTVYANNPVIDSESSQFRDPQVTWYEDHWVMAIAYAQDFTIGFYTSPDLKEWKHASNFTNYGLLGLQYECPNLVRMPVVQPAPTDAKELFVLLISINPGAPLGGSITEFFPGTFNGTHFTAVDSAARIADFGKDNYATQFFSGLQDEAVSIGWASNWQYTQQVPTGPMEGWRSAMSLPRRNFLTGAERIGWVLGSEPYDLSPVLGDQIGDEKLGNGTITLDYAGVQSNALYWEANITGIPSSGVASYASLNITFFSSTSGESLAMGFYLGGDVPFWLDRGRIRGFENPFFTDKVSTNTLIGSAGTWRIAGVIDRSIVEVFLEGGRHSATQTFYPKEKLEVMSVRAGDLPTNASVSVGVWEVVSAWME